MHIRCRVLVLLVTVLPGFVRAQASDLVLEHAKIYPSPTAPAIEDGSIVIHDERIVSVGNAITVSIPAGAQVLDCKGMVVTAGFWNSHVHVLLPGLLHGKDSNAADLNSQLDTIFNRWGFTTVFDLSSPLANTLALRKRITDGELRGPRILTVGEPVWTVEPVYVRDFLAQYSIHIPDTKTPAQAIALVEDHAAKGADGIKLFTGSAQDHEKVAALPLDVARAAVSEAHRHGLPVFAHPQDLAGVEIAIDSGVDVLAHTVPQSPAWTPEFVARLKAANIALIPTLTLFDFEGRKAKLTPEELEAWFAKMDAQVKAYADAGGTILFGTDVGYTTHFDTAMEFTMMARAGMHFEQILASMTTAPAARFKKADRLGKVAGGMQADLVVLKDDPARDVTAFSRVHATICGGKVIYLEGPAKTEAGER